MRAKASQDSTEDVPRHAYAYSVYAIHQHRSKVSARATSILRLLGSAAANTLVLCCCTCERLRTKHSWDGALLHQGFPPNLIRKLREAAYARRGAYRALRKSHHLRRALGSAKIQRTNTKTTFTSTKRLFLTYWGGLCTEFWPLSKSLYDFRMLMGSTGLRVSEQERVP